MTQLRRVGSVRAFACALLAVLSLVGAVAALSPAPAVLDSAAGVVQPQASQRLLAVGRSGEGVVSSVPGGIACGNTCSANYADGTVVDLTAVAAPLWRFVEWRGDCSGSGACSVVMDRTRVVDAIFERVGASEHQLGIAVEPAIPGGLGRVFIMPGGGYCDTVCQAMYARDSVLTLTAVPVPPAVFVGWRGACSGANPVCVVTMDGPKQVVADFGAAPAQYLLGLAVNPAIGGPGRITAAPPGASCDTVCAVHYDAGTVVTLTPTANPGWRFDHWTGACSGSGPCVVTMDAGRSVAAEFVRNTAEWIFWASDRAGAAPGHSHIWAMLPDGTGAQQVTFGPAVDSQPALSPDGTKLAFTRAAPAPGACPAVWLKDLETGTETPLGPPAGSEMPAWDGGSIMVLFSMFSEIVPGGGCAPANRTPPSIFGVTILGVALPPLILPPDANARTWPSWAADNSQVLFSRVAGANPGELWVKPAMAAETPLVQLPSNEKRPRLAPTVPPDRLAWVSDRFGQTEIVAASLVSPMLPIRITTSDGSDGPAWSPDTSWLVFQTRQAPASTSFDVWRASSLGGPAANLTADPNANDTDPWWGTLAAFTTPSVLPPGTTGYYILSGTNGTGHPGAPCAADPLVRYRLTPAGPAQPALIGSGMPASPCTVFNTVGGIASQTVTTADAADAEAYFEFDFTVPAGGVTAMLNVSLRGDDGAAVLLDGVPVNGTSDWSAGTSVYAAGPLAAGPHTVQIHVVRTGTNDWNGGVPAAVPGPTDALDIEFEATLTHDQTSLLTVARIGSGDGDVTSAPAGIACGADCSEAFGPLASVTLTATPAPGSRFVGWGGDADCADGTVSMAADRACTAEFRRVYDLTLTTAGNGVGSASPVPPGSACGAGCWTYDADSVVTLSQMASPGSRFTGWSGDADCADGSVTMAAARACTANFELVPVGTAVRDLPACVSLTARTVTIAVTAVASVHAYAVEDVVPPGWGVSAISHGGVLDVRNRKVKWGPFTNPTPPQARVLSYVVTPGGPGDGAFAGTAAFEETSVPVTGDAIAPVCLSHPADTQPDPAGAPFGDWRMTAVEVTAYAGAWQRGQPWPNLPSPIPVEFVTRAGFLWATCESYAVDPGQTAPLTWVTNCTGAPALEAAAAAARATRARRQLNGCYAGGVASPVLVAVTPASPTRAWAIEERVPAGWIVGQVSDGGTFDAATGTLRWGPFFDAAPRTLTYRVVPSAGDKGPKRFAGVASGNGSLQPIAGEAQLNRCRAGR
jgi:hypothetical protein